MYIKLDESRKGFPKNQEAICRIIRLAGSVPLTRNTSLLLDII